MMVLKESGMLEHLKAFVGLDIHVLASMLFRGWDSLERDVTNILLPLFPSPIDRVFYYTFCMCAGFVSLLRVGPQLCTDPVGRPLRRALTIPVLSAFFE